MPSLRELQHGFACAMLGDESPRVLLESIRADGIDPAARLQIHRNHVLVTLKAALKSTYPVVCRLVDERFFDYAAHEYVRENPPTGPCLFEYGGSFPDFLAGFAPAATLLYLADVARLEWLLNRAWHAEDRPALDVSALAGVTPAEAPRLRVGLDPSLGLIRAAWPADEIWRACTGDGVDEGLEIAAGEFLIEIRRRHGDVVVTRLDPPIFAFREALSAEATLEGAAERALALDPLFDLAVALRRLFIEEAIVSLDPSEGG